MKRLILLCVLVSLVLTRTIGLNWGLPQLMHPDENNMIFAILRLNCKELTLKSCFNPHFFAYGQLTLYLSYLSLVVYKNIFSVEITPAIVALSLRIISALASIFTGWVFYLLFKKEFKSKFAAILGLFFYVFSPGLIQQAHFGTTESLLTLFLLLSLYYRRNLYLSSFFIGLAAASKISSLSFFIFPALTLLNNVYKFGLQKNIKKILVSLLLVFLTLFIFSPHYLLNFSDFWQSFVYESGVATGKLRVFYTQQFENTLPLIFQLTKIFPYALGWPLTILSLAGIFFFKRKHSYFLIGLIFLFLINSFLYVKWTRFMTPFLPLFIYSAVSFYQKYYKKKLARYLLSAIVVYQLIFGLAFMTIYLSSDVRETATAWINKNIKKNSVILSESANAVDIPIATASKYQYYSLFLYDLDTNNELWQQYQKIFSRADFIFVPTRRIFSNYTCYQSSNENIKKSSYCRSLEKKYPRLHKHYQELFFGDKFKLIKTFTSYPRIVIFGYVLFEFPDEFAEETWTVFDHPVIRIYKRVS